MRLNGKKGAPLLIFGGTSEGRALYEAAKERGVEAVLSVATEYGREAVDPSDGGILVNRLSQEEMETLIGSGFSLVMDATHPHARLVSPAIQKACEAAGAQYLRVLRAYKNGEEDSPAVRRVESIGEAVDFLEGQEGNILVTTGSKELTGYKRLSGFASRVYARVLPVESSIKICAEAGLPARRILAMQGPFSAAFNSAVIREFDCKWLVTKDTGISGGYYEKIQAAEACGAGAVVISAPKEQGVGLEEALERIRSLG